MPRFVLLHRRHAAPHTGSIESTVDRASRADDVFRDVAEGVCARFQLDFDPKLIGYNLDALEALLKYDMTQ